MRPWIGQHFRVWRVIKCFKNKYTQPANASCWGDRETIQKLYALAEEMLPPTAFFDTFPQSFQENEFLEAPFTEAELSTALTSVIIKSSLDLDKTDNNILLQLPNEVKIAVLPIYNGIYLSGSFPDSWNNFLIFFVPKSSPVKFRAISLASCLLKLMERLI